MILLLGLGTRRPGTSRDLTAMVLSEVEACASYVKDPCSGSSASTSASGGRRVSPVHINSISNLK